ncbi:amidohydrolase [Rhodobacteraceae bacterium 2CG4]|uniref:Amidohydrolase n=1 Tax=Halovulum marinum TaxID=2662447 RepID=A0A6L5Z0Z9_9RHOB|nr:M20 aminoacylase family protein [Halovulum marinum]MSU90221.1 amidohydrolase [Halovulum marinum]
MAVLNRIAEFRDDMTAWRQHLHAHPELMFDTHQTAAFVVERLRDFGVDTIETGIGRTGVVALIRGQADGPAIGLRADMDALPIAEAPDRAYKSTVPGKMHACGHDGHTTILLGAARYLAETRNFAGTVALIFQPAEEGGGGAKEMVDEGLMDRFGIERVFALHNWPGVPVGRIEMNAGPAMAASDVFTITVNGRGAHAAYPQNSIDPIAVGAQIVQALQTISARNLSPLEQAVISVTEFHAGTTNNVIPPHAVLAGTVRTLDEDLRQRLAVRLREVCEGVAAAQGATVAIDYEFGYPVTVNHDAEVAFAAQAAADVVGAENVFDQRRAEMGAEDFAYMLQARPGAYVFLGQGDSAPLHHPDYDFNDEAAPIGASYFVRLVERGLPLAR